MQHSTLLTELFASIDAMDADRFVDFIAADGVFRFGSAPAVQGREAIREAVVGFFSSITGLRHTLHQSLVDGDILVCEGEATYTRHDSSEITLPFANVFKLRNGIIAHYKIYSDIGPLFAD
jgi:ketosteroid isomerase-like protein